MKAFRIYTTAGCPSCKEAMEYLTKKSVSFEAVEAGFCPVINRGLQSLFGTNPIQYPLLVVNFTQEMIAGWNQVEYDRVIEATRQAMVGLFAEPKKAD